MTRHWPAFIAAVAVAAAAPAWAQDRPPPPGWGDPQAPDGPPVAGAPFVPPSPGAYPLPGPPPFPPGPMPPPPPGAWGPGPAYPYAPAATPCGCGAPAYAYAWVPVQIRTNYVYSPAVERVREVPEEHVVYHEAVETRTVRVRGKAKYVKSARPVKLTKGKTVRSVK
jgi:hypothetical protein